MNNQRVISRYLVPFVLLLCSLPVVLLLFGAGQAALQTDEGHPAESGTNVSPGEIQVLNQFFDDSDLAEGRDIYTRYCAACHGAEGQGQFPTSPLEPDASGRIGAPPHNETGHSWHHSDTSLIRYITEGGFSDPARYYPMPPFGNILTDEQILRVTAYLKTLWTAEQRASQHQLTIEEESMFSQ